MSKQRKLKFGQAIREATFQAMQLSESVFVYGIGVDGKSGVFGTTMGLVQEFGSKRVFDTPISEQALTFFGIGAANAGLRPVLVHQRLDFLVLTMDQLANWAGPWRFMSGGQATLPLTIRAIIGKGWGQGPQHSKSLHSWFAHVPGLQVVVPATPYDAKGLLLSSILSNDPTVFIEGRALFDMEGEVPEQPYFIEIGKSIVRREGTDLTLVAFGTSVPIALNCADRLTAEGRSVEVVDLRSLAPLDIETVCRSVAKTGHLVVLEGDWKPYGVGAEIVSGRRRAAIVAVEECSTAGGVAG